MHNHNLARVLSSWAFTQSFDFQQKGTRLETLLHVGSMTRCLSGRGRMVCAFADPEGCQKGPKEAKKNMSVGSSGRSLGYGPKCKAACDDSHGLECRPVLSPSKCLCIHFFGVLRSIVTAGRDL